MSYLAGLEIGGTKLVAVLAKGRAIVDRAVIPTQTPAETLGAAADVLARWHRETPFSAIGVASFGPVRIDDTVPDYGHILATPKPGWQGADLLAPLKTFDVPLALDTDVNAAALAELSLGAGRGCDTLVYITIGTGIGGGIVVSGRPVHGVLHPELGHLRLRRVDRDVFAGVCPFHGDCIEGLVSGPALHARFGMDAGDVPADDPRWQVVSADLAQLLANLMLTISPKRIVIGGGVGLGQGAMVRDAAAMVPGLLGGYLDGVDKAFMATLVVPPELGGDAGPLGAILLAKTVLNDQAGGPSSC